MEEIEKNEMVLHSRIKRFKNNDVFDLINRLGINHYQKNHGSPLLIACLYNNTEIAKYCIENKANLNVSDSGGFTPLIYACINGNYEIAKLLLEKGADIHIQNKFEKSAISKAIEDHPENLELIELLLKHGGNPYTIENYRKEARMTLTAYDYALKELKSKAIIELIEKYTPNPNW